MISCTTTPTVEEATLPGLENSRFDTSISITFQNSKLTLKSIVNRDTLSGQWADAIYGTPIVQMQQLLFYENQVEVKNHLPSIGRKIKTGKSSKPIEVASFPIFDICVIPGATGSAYYYVYGADFCNGINCSEFTGIYTLKGEIIFEGKSSDPGFAERLLQVQKNNNLHLSNGENCNSIFGLWKNEKILEK